MRFCQEKSRKTANEARQFNMLLFSCLSCTINLAVFEVYSYLLKRLFVNSELLANFVYYIYLLSQCSERQLKGYIMDRVLVSLERSVP